MCMADCNGNTALHTAAIADNKHAIEALLAGGADVEAANRLGHTPLISACVHGAKAAVHALLEHGGNVHARDRRQQLSLHHAVWANNVPVARLLLAAGLSVRAQFCSSACKAFVMCSCNIQNSRRDAICACNLHMPSVTCHLCMQCAMCSCVRRFRGLTHGNSTADV